MRPNGRAPVVIVGAGFSGVMLAAQLARRGIDSVLIEGRGRAYRGTAYSTGEPVHLLNVRAEAMSAWPDDPADFARALEMEGGGARDFAERGQFGRYLTSILDQALASQRVQLVEKSAVAAVADPDGWRVTLSDGSFSDGKRLVLANGNQPPEPLDAAAGAGERFHNDPWTAEARAAVRDAADQDADVLLVGTGLTMVDLVLSLDAAGHRGRIVALSRRGLIPRVHADFTPAPTAWEDLPQGNLLTLWRWLRRRSGEVGWRAAVDSLRPHSQALWQSLGEGQHRRFLRHARPWWDVHRHRIAPQVAQRLTGIIAEGRLRVAAGRIRELRGGADALTATIQRRGGGETAMEFAHAFNCTGPLGAIGRTNDPLLRDLLARGAIAPDPLGLGIAVDATNRVAASPRLWALGPLTKGRYWEITSVPDIRGQAAAVAGDIARELLA